MPVGDCSVNVRLEHGERRCKLDGSGIEVAGGWLSVIVLLTIAGLDLQQLRTSRGGTFVGLRTTFFVKYFSGSGSSLLALPVGFLFGLGFETSSQIAVYGVALGVNSGALGAALVGAMFCVGMVVTDTLDSLLVHQLISTRTSLSPTALRTWSWPLQPLPQSSVSTKPRNCSGGDRRSRTLRYVARSYPYSC